MTVVSVRSGKDKNRIRYNVAALSVLQVANYLIPLITIPYLARVLGEDGFGKYSYVQNVMQYMMLLTDFGISWSGTKKIATLRNDKKGYSEAFISRWTIQWVLVYLLGLFLLVFVVIKYGFTDEAILYAAGYIMVIGNVMMPVWLFHGLEKMRAVSLMLVIGRIGIIPSMYFLVRDINGVLWGIIIFGLGQMMSGIISLLWIKKDGLIVWRLPGLKNMYSVIKEDYMIFLSTLSMSLYTTITPVVLGGYVSPGVVGYYNMGNKVRLAAQAFLAPFSKALYPRMSYLFSFDGVAAYRLLKYSALVMLPLSLLVSFLIYYFSYDIIKVIGGDKYSGAVLILKILSPTPFFVSLSSVAGVQVVLPKGGSSYFSNIYITVGLIGLVFMFPLIMYYKEVGAALFLSGIECVIGFVMCWHAVKILNDIER
ncbi:MAG: flippase [Bacteroidetes bacterium]|nr:flippase [Bacteroidota bacterium]